MKTINPSLDNIIDNYRTMGECTITLKNGQILTGNFDSDSFKESGIIKEWYFIPKKETNSIPIRHDQIAVIENAL